MTPMLVLHTKLPAGAGTAIHAQLVLPYELREKCRLRAVLSNGREAAVYTPRGTVLRGGDVLTGEDRAIAVQVVAACEPVYKVTCGNALALLRCAFHLGNRHTQAQLGDGYLRIRADAVLKDMLLGLGATVVEESAPFEPEAGAYGGGHHHGHEHGNPLAPVPARQKIHRPSDLADGGPVPDTAAAPGSAGIPSPPGLVIPAQAGIHAVVPGAHS